VARASGAGIVPRIAQLPLGAMELRPRVPLARVLGELGRNLLTARFLPPDSGGDVLDVVIWDAHDPPETARGDLVLAVGVRDDRSLVALLERLAGSHVAGLVVKLDTESSKPLPPALHEAARAGSVALVQLVSDASWEQILVLVRSLLVRSPHLLDAGHGAAEDLFALADFVGAVLDAPVTIEDRSSRVLAFSGSQTGADAARRETILGRRVPEHYTRVFEEQGVFRRLQTASDPVYVERLSDEHMPRVAVGVRAGDEFLGSIWAAVSEPLPPEREAWLADATKLVALHLLRLRAEADVGHGLRAELLASLLEGGDRSNESAGRLGLAAGPFCVLAAVPVEGDPTSAEADRQRLSTALSVHLTAVRPRSTVAAIGGTVYAVVTPVDASDRDGDGPAALAQQFVEYADHGQTFLVGVGRPAKAVVELARSRAEADRALAVLRRDPRGRQVARFVDVQLEALLHRLADLASSEGELLPGSIAALVDYDERHNAGLLETLAAYLDHFGDIALASGTIHVHPNTFRYRLRRLQAISGIDLEDPDARLLATLQLRLRAIAERRDERRRLA
jgi:hypothetical protein